MVLAAWCVCHAAVPGATPLRQLLGDVMILAKAKGYDVFNALDLLQVRSRESAFELTVVLCINGWVAVQFTGSARNISSKQCKR